VGHLIERVCPNGNTTSNDASRSGKSGKPINQAGGLLASGVCRELRTASKLGLSAPVRWQECTPPAGLNRERPCERLLCELACLVSYLYRRVRANSEIRGLLGDAVCVGALLLGRVYEVESENYFFRVWQNDVEAVSIVPSLRLVKAAVESLKRLGGRRVLREREQWNEQRCEGRNASCHGFVKESTGYRGGASVNFPDGAASALSCLSWTFFTPGASNCPIPLPKCRMIRHNARGTAY
jgi:hypothetical protein